MEQRETMSRLLAREALPDRSGEKPQERLCVGIIGVSASAGTSMLTRCLARRLAEARKYRPAVLELSDGDEGNTGWIYDAAGMERRFAGRPFHSCYRIIREGGLIRSVVNPDEGVNWALRLPQEANLSLTPQEMGRLIHNLAGDRILCDFSARLTSERERNGDQMELLKSLLLEMDAVIAVLDPAPARLIGGRDRLSMIRQVAHTGRPVLFVINRWNSGVNAREFFRFTRLRDPVRVPVLDAAEQYEAEYHCKTPWEMSRSRELLQKPLEEICRRLSLT